MLRRMTFATRLTLATSLMALLSFGAVGAWQVSAEEADLRRATIRDLRVLGSSLEVAFENALRDRQSEDVEETLRELERLDPSVDIYLLGEWDEVLAASAGARIPPPPALAEGVEVELRGHRPTARLTLSLEPRGRDGVPKLLVVRPLDGAKRDLDATRRRVVVSVLAFVLAVAILTAFSTRWWVGRPLARMIARMRRVRAGDLTPDPRTPEGANEVAAALAEFDALVRDLALARARLDEETEARRRLERALRDIDKLATIGQLAAGVAHEIGSPLQVLEGRLETLATRDHDAAYTRRVAAILRDQTRRITRIVARLTDLVPRRHATPACFDPAPHVQAVVELLDGEARRRGVRLATESDGAPPEVVADPDALQQIVLNLVRNALEASEPGGRVSVRVGRGTLAEPGADGVPSLRLEVEDDGVGMDDEARSRALEAFFTTRAPRGSGLGLAVVKSLVDDAEGRIELRSRPAEGTLVRVDLPLDGPEPPAQPRPPDAR